MAQALDYSLRCNSLTCRTPLTERAVVTTCSQCPACQSSLLNPDDAVSTVLNPTEDYKTSVLSGLDPNTVMECAGRALAFWTYQTTQEIFYQEYLGKGLTEKYAALNNQMDKVVHDANSEITSLQNRMQDMQISQEQLLKKNQELVELYRDKSKKHAQVTNLYNILKSRAMRSQIATAATDSISQTLDSLGSRHGHDMPQEQQHHRSSRVSGQLNQNSRPFSAVESPRHARLGSSLGHFGSGASVVGNPGVDRLSRHQRSGTGSSTSGSNRPKRRMTMDSLAMPPPPPPGRISLNMSKPRLSIV
ncbi:hypothetical protein KEM56_003246 [Ascosphaera pollenicola]|nr:hypothetical protein KEM56_003246 [Ascosphaera pollenicola]